MAESEPGNRRHWPSYPPRHYLGQLEEDFQHWLADQRKGISIADCDWYHTVTLTDGTVVPGAWDLRGAEPTYLGEIPFAGQRVLEVGPASGYLTVWMEHQGAEVVGLETGFDVPNAVLPVRGKDMREEAQMLMTQVDRVHNSWWYYHFDQSSAAKLVHADVYNMPGDLGKFDVSVFGCVLLHLRDPWTALVEAAMRTENVIVVTDPLEEGLENGNVMRFAPGQEHEITNWWTISPGAVCTMLGRLGFSSTAVGIHRQPHHMGHRLNEAPISFPLFTVVGRRP